jgi:hypothetical protein
LPATFTAKRVIRRLGKSIDAHNMIIVALLWSC